MLTLWGPVIFLSLALSSRAVCRHRLHRYCVPCVGPRITQSSARRRDFAQAGGEGRRDCELGSLGRSLGVARGRVTSFA